MRWLERYLTECFAKASALRGGRSESGDAGGLASGGFYTNRSARLRRFASAAALRVRSAGVELASSFLRWTAHFACSVRDIWRITSCPDAICSRMCSSFASCLLRSRSRVVFATCKV